MASFRNAQLAQLKKSLVGLGEAPHGAPARGDLDPARQAARRFAIKAAQSVDCNWSECSGQVGPIDVIDMFSGCGGMSAGFTAINAMLPAYKVALAIDIDRVANTTFEQNIGVRPAEEDVSRLADSPNALERVLKASARRDGHPLVLIGCAPCQGFSSHRNKAGSRDRRNNLFVDFARIAARLRPDAVIVENVPELLTSRYWHFVDQARSVLERAGYVVYLGVHNMAEFGLPQERFRALMLALPHAFHAPEGFVGRSAFRTVRQAIGSLPKIAAGARCPTDGMHYTAGHHDSTLRTIRAVPLDGGNRPPHIGPDCLRRGEARQGKAMYEDVYGRLHWDRPSITITASARNPASGRFVHPEQHRALSVREAALLQGFPGRFSFSGTLDERYRQIGNAVPPAFSSFLAAHLLGELLGARLSTHPALGITEPVGKSFSRMIPGLKAASRRNQVLAANGSLAFA
jgi:DNA (cytosine-5)-methyltransferase 1